MSKMIKADKEVIQYQLDSEKATLKELEKQYQRALNQINSKIRILQSDQSTQSRIYRLEYQKALKRQVEAILEKLHSDEYDTINDYLKSCYEDGYIGTMYSIASQGAPIIVPIDQDAVAKAVVVDTKLKEDLYTSLGYDIDKLKKDIRGEITRGLASGMTYSEIARNLSDRTSVSLSSAKRIARTEGHRVNQTAADDARQAAIDSGADVVKQWDSILDGKTRDNHRILDGQIRKQKEYFTVGTHKALYPSQFGLAEEDINCRCQALTRAKWALDQDELKTLRERAVRHGLYLPEDKKKGDYKKAKVIDFADFKSKYLIASEQYRRKVGKNGQQIIDKATYSKVTRSFVRNGGLIIRGEEAERHLAVMGAYASYLPSLNSAYIRDEATVSDVLEEMYHAEQDRLNKYGTVLTEEVLLRREIDAQKYLISVTEKYKIPAEEVEVTKANLVMYEKRLEALLARGEQDE